MSTPSDNVARIVKTLLVHQGKTRGELAESLHVHVSAVSKALSGKRDWDVNDLVTMAEFFEVSPALFFEDSRTLIRSVSTPSDPDGGGVSRGITSRNTGENFLDDTLLKIAA